MEDLDKVVAQAEALKQVVVEEVEALEQVVAGKKLGEQQGEVLHEEMKACDEQGEAENL